MLVFMFRRALRQECRRPEAASSQHSPELIYPCRKRRDLVRVSRRDRGRRCKEHPTSPKRFRERSPDGISRADGRRKSMTTTTKSSPADLGAWTKKMGRRKPRPMRCGDLQPPEGNSCCDGTGRKTVKCISCFPYDQFLISWKTFIVQCSYAYAAAGKPQAVPSSRPLCSTDLRACGQAE